MRLPASLTVALFAGLFIPLLQTQLVQAAPEPFARFKSGKHQAELAFARDGDEVRVAACRAQRCDWSRTATVPVPATLLPSLTSDALVLIALDAERSVVRLTLPEEGRAWEALVVAPAKSEAAPRVIFADFTGLAPNGEGEWVGRGIEVYPKDAGGHDVVVGQLQRDVSLCGRPTLLDPRVLYPTDLTLRRVKLQRLPAAERAAAISLRAVADSDLRGVNVSRAVVASSAKGSPQALSDGDQETVWSEGRGGDGSGEFVVFRVPKTAAISRIAWTYPAAPSLSSPSVGDPGAMSGPAAESSLAVPTRMWLATDSSLYRIEVEASEARGRTVSVQLPQAVQSSCLALVLDAADRQGADLDVSLAEFQALADISKQDVSELVARLNHPAGDFEAAAAMLSALGVQGLRALEREYPRLSAVGRARALSVYDTLGCTVSARAYARSVRGDKSAEDRHALEALARCGQAGAEAAARELTKADAERTSELAPLLARLNPKLALERLVPLLTKKKNGARRRALRHAIHRAVAGDGAQPVESGRGASPPSRAALLRLVGSYLADEQLSQAVALELLRALDDEVTAVKPEASSRVKAMLAAEPGYRERYLLLQPVSRLASVDASLRAELASMATNDHMAPVRARAAKLLPRDDGSVKTLMRAAQDPEVRVRLAAVESLGELKPDAAEQLLSELVEQDPWPLIRAASARALAEFRPSAAIDRVLTESAEGDSSASVRRPALFALGARGARRSLPVVRDRLNDADEDPYVRAAAAATLGTLCDQAAVEMLTRYAKPLARINTDETTLVVGKAALSALGRLAPADLTERLALYDDQRTPLWVKQVVEAARKHPQRCAR